MIIGKTISKSGDEYKQREGRHLVMMHGSPLLLGLLEQVQADPTSRNPLTWALFALIELEARIVENVFLLNEMGEGGERYGEDGRVMIAN